MNLDTEAFAIGYKDGYDQKFKINVEKRQIFIYEKKNILSSE